MQMESQSYVLITLEATSELRYKSHVGITSRSYPLRQIYVRKLRNKTMQTETKNT